MSDEEYLEVLTEEDPMGLATEADWEDFWLETGYYEDTDDDEDEEF